MLRCWHSARGSCSVITCDRDSSRCSRPSRSSSRGAWPWGLRVSTCPPTWLPEAWVTPGYPRPTPSSSPTRPATVPVQAWHRHLPPPAPFPPLCPPVCPLCPPTRNSTCMAPPPLPPPVPPHRCWWETQTWWADSTGYSAPKYSTVPFSFPTQVLLSNPVDTHLTLQLVCARHCVLSVLTYMCMITCYCAVPKTVSGIFSFSTRGHTKINDQSLKGAQHTKYDSVMNTFNNNIKLF